MNKPTKFEHIVKDECRITIRAEGGCENEPAIMKIDHQAAGSAMSGSFIHFRITSKKARALAEWLERYAQWAEAIPARGGR